MWRSQVAHHRKKRPTKVIGNKCMLCQFEKVMGNSRKMWGSDFHYSPTKSERKRIAERERLLW